jgi:homocysteine S-methyltransferase
MLRAARQVQAAGVQRVNVADRPGGRERMDSVTAALAIRTATTLDPIVHLAARRRSSAELTRDLDRLADAGITTVLAVTGDRAVDTATSDLDSLEVLAIVADHAPQMRAGVVLDPFAADLGRELARLERKTALGAAFVMTQPLFDEGSVEHVLELTAHVGVPVVIGVLPLVDATFADHLRAVPGLRIPDDIPDDAHAATRELIATVRARVDGIALHPARGDVAGALDLLAPG